MDSGSAAWAEAPQHEADHGETDEGCGFSGVSLVIAREPTAAADPREGPLHDPAFWEHDEAVTVAAPNDLQVPRAGAGDGGLHLPSLVARVADDALDERKAPSRLPEQRLCAVAVLHARGMDADRQEQAERIGQDMALAANDLLAGIVPGRVERSPPLTAPFAV